MNKSLTVNIIAVLFIVAGYTLPFYPEHMRSIGFFGLSGAITNWIAIYMLFERVPFLYGSGVIPRQFVQFKLGIKHLIMNEFFTDENVDRFFEGQQDSTVAKMDFGPIISAIDFNEVFEGFLETVEQSNFGQMLGMIGGVKALEPLRKPFNKKLKSGITRITKTESFRHALETNMLPSHISQDVIAKVEDIVDQRLDELTPEIVKDIMQTMIREHLGWLVVWGGVFGGMIGLAMSWVKIM